MTARMRTRNRQPLGPLPLTEKAAWVFLPTVPVELVTGTPVTYGSAGATYSSDEGGRALDTTASADGSRYAEIAHSSRLQIPSGAAVFVLRVKLTANLGARISKTTGNGGSDSEFDFVAYEYLGAGVLTLGLTRVGGGGSRGWGVLESAYRPPANKWVTLAAYAPPLVDSPSVFFADGVRLSVSDLGGTGTGSPDTTTQPIRFNKRDDLSTSNDQSKIAIAYAIPGGNEAMAERLSRNPWRLFAPQRTARIYSFPVGGATAIPILGAAVSGATASGSLSTAISLAGATATISATATGDLSTTIRLAGGAVAGALASGGLSTGIPLAGGGSVGGAGTGDLSTGSGLAGAGAAGAAGTGVLTTQITLSGSAIAQAIASGALTTTPSGLAGDGTSSSSGSGSLSTGIPLAGAAAVSVVGAGGLVTAIPLAGAATAAVSATGDLVVSLGLAGAALISAIGSGALLASITLNGAAVTGAVGAGALSGAALHASPWRTVTSLARVRSVRATARVRRCIAGVR